MRKMCFIICLSGFLLSAAFSTSAQSQTSVQEETIEESISEDSGTPLSDHPSPTTH